MSGLARRMFAEKLGKNPFKIKMSASNFVWPLLNRALAEKRLSYVDVAFSQAVLQSTGVVDESIAAFICHISMAARQGHLCVSVESVFGIMPSPKDVWEQSACGGILDEFDRLVKEGSKKIPDDLEAICQQGNRFYLERNWELESTFLKHMLAFLTSASNDSSLDMDGVHRSVDILDKAGKLESDQRLAIVRGCQNNLFVLTGGPGTGKTYTAGLLLRTLWENLSSEKRKGYHIELAAPTGKAAAHLAASIHGATQGIPEFPELTAKTLHMLLGIGQRSPKQTVLAADIVLIDESSMIDALMFAKLMAALKPTAKLILLGDKFQLPPVESGSLFADLVQYLQGKPNIIELKKCLRSDLKGILSVAEIVKNKGNEDIDFESLEGVTLVPLQPQSALDEASQPASSSVTVFSQFQSDRELQKQLVRYASNLFPSKVNVIDAPEEALKLFSKFRILTPMRKGFFGAEELNSRLLQAARVRSQQDPFCVAPIMIVRNDYRRELFNGEMGLLVTFKEDSRKDYAVFPEHQQGDVRIVPAILLPPFEYAYCISIHKSQGSEFDHTLLFLPEGSQSFGSEALYTGITRARRCLEIWSTSKILRQMAANYSIRHSGINLKDLK